MNGQKILITGCAGDIALGIARILRDSYPAVKLYGCDIQSDHPGDLFFEKSLLVAPAGSPGFQEQLRSIVGQLGIDFLIPTSDAEIWALLNSGLTERIVGTTVILANRKALEIGSDKFQTARFLMEADLPYPWTCLAEEGEPPGFPCVMKPNRGQGSKNFRILRSPDDYRYYAQDCDGYIFQEYLPGDDAEYTCGLFGLKNREIRSIIFRRVLKGDATGKGVIELNDEIDAVLRQLAVGLNLSGSINVQLRLTSSGPKIFEINPRFSSTVVFRHKLGFRDVIWALRDATGEPVGEYTPPKSGVRIYRGIDEYIIGSGE